MAEAFRHGRGVTQDNKEALKWYRKAAKNGPKGLVDESILKELTESVEEGRKRLVSKRENRLSW